MPRLKANVALRNPETGTVEVFVSGATPPRWAAEAITNDDVWDSDPEPTSEEWEDGDLPPRHGPGSGRAAWALTATARGVSVTDDMTRDDIIAAVDAG